MKHPALDAVRKGFQDDLAANGIEARYHLHNAQGNMATAQQIASQIIGEKPNLILTIATPTSQAMAQALKKAPHMKDTPMLFTAVTDPLTAGLVKNLDHPGGNITGVSDKLPVAKHMANIRKFLPNLKTLGVLYNAGEANSKATVKTDQSGVGTHGGSRFRTPPSPNPPMFTRPPRAWWERSTPSLCPRTIPWSAGLKVR